MINMVLLLQYNLKSYFNTFETFSAFVETSFSNVFVQTLRFIQALKLFP